MKRKISNKSYSHLTSEIEAIYHEAALKFRLSDSALRILYVICLQGDGCLLSEVVRISGISKQTINSSMRKLEKDGILYLETVEGNKKKIILTNRGKELVSNSAMIILNIENEIITSWSLDDQEKYIKLTSRFLNELSEKIRSI